MKPITSIAALTVVALSLVACGDDDNNASNNTTANNTTANNTTANNTTANNTTANNTTPVPFADVAAIMGASCAVGGCHLDPGNGTSFLIGAGAGAAEIQTALDGISTAGGRALVVGGDLDNSEVYLRVTGTTVTQMPLGGMLDPDEITTITDWISGGASFD